MRKNIKRLFIVLLAFMLSGCLGNISPKERVQMLLSKYINNDETIMDELDEYLSTQDLTETQKQRYREIIKNEYSQLQYEILDETIEDDTATVKAKINVTDLYGASEEAENDLLDNPTDFYNDGLYDASKFIDYKLSIMEGYTKRIDYEIDVVVQKVDGTWKINSLDEETLEKIHGIYNYNA